jgi:hypothetical protein
LNPWVRATMAIALLAGVAWALWEVRGTQPAGGSSGDFHVQVVGPEGELYNGTVSVADADALQVLRAAADSAGFSVEVVDYGGYGECGQYVSAIAGIEESGTAGWVYEVRSTNGWHRPMQSAACQSLDDGDAVRWSWVDHA